MEKYDYRNALREDIIEWISDRPEMIAEYIDEYGMSRDIIEEELNDKLWIEDSVTGNASGSYWCNSWRAEEAICHNLDLLAEAVEEFGGSTDVLRDGAESCDVTIRCYLLGEVISDVLDDLENEIDNLLYAGELSAEDALTVALESVA